MRYAEFLERDHFTNNELIASGKGNLVEDPPEGGVARLPSPPFLMFDRITEIEKNGRTGRMVAEQDIAPDAWFFQCHFQGDPVQPGCLGLDAVWQLLGFYQNACGAAGSGRALGCRSVEFEGQIRPFDKLVRYDLQVRRFTLLKDSGASIAIANATVSVDGQKIYTIQDAKVGIFKDIAYTDYPNPDSEFARGGLMKR